MRERELETPYLQLWRLDDELASSVFKKLYDNEITTDEFLTLVELFLREVKARKDAA